MATSIVEATKYWVSTVSRAHVLLGVEGGFCQACHGKKGPIARMKPGDWLVYYSPKNTMEGNEVCQKFTAIGEIADAKVYRFNMSEGFTPFRRNVTYIQHVQELSIRPLLGSLSFTKERGNKWGAAFRFGMLEITKQDFNIIYEGMVIQSKTDKRREPEDDQKKEGSLSTEPPEKRRKK